MSASAKLSNAGRILTIHVPLPVRRSGSRKFVLGPSGIAWSGQRILVDSTIVKALGRAHRWKAMLESGHYRSMTELAAEEKVNLSYLCRIIRLTLLAPDIVEELLDGRHTKCQQISELLKPIPLLWTGQRSTFRIQKEIASMHAQAPSRTRNPRRAVTSALS